MTAGSPVSRSFWELTIGEKIAFVFNRTMLGLGVMTGLWLADNGSYLEAGVICFVFVPVYFLLVYATNAP